MREVRYKKIAKNREIVDNQFFFLKNHLSLCLSSVLRYTISAKPEERERETGGGKEKMAALLRRAAAAAAVVLLIAAAASTDGATSFYASDPNLGSARVVFQVRHDLPHFPELLF